MNKNLLKNIDSLDIDETLIAIEQSFGIKFEDEELKNINSFGELNDCIMSKIQLENEESCTTLQAFYKLRRAIIETKGTEWEAIFPKQDLQTIFTKNTRKEDVRRIEEYLDIKLNLISSPDWLNLLLTYTLLISVILCFIFPIAIFGTFLIFCGLYISSKLGNTLTIKTVGELVKKMTRENYLLCRNNPQTYNKDEIENIIKDFFCEFLFVKREELTRDLSFV